MGTLEVDKSLKAAFKETLEPHGFKKVKGRYPHFVRMATPEIIQVINYRLEQALSPQLEEKRFEVYCAVGSIYRPEINLNRSVYASMDWINTTHLEMYVKAKCNGIPVYENEQPGVDYIIKKGDEASLREQIAFAMTGIEHYIIPAFDKVVDLKTCVDYLELYDFSNLYISRKTECNGDVFILQAKYPNADFVLTYGEKGAWYVRNGETVYCPAKKVKVIDTTAAGDTFTGYFLSARGRGYGVEESLKKATAAAGEAVTRKGAAVSIPCWKELEEK